MIIYDNRDVLFIFLKKGGSVLLSKYVLLPAVFSTGLGAILLVQSQSERQVVISSNIARIYATILGFVIVFRTSMAFGRFFEGVTHVQTMFSKWRDAFTSLVAFIECSITVHAKKGDVGLVEEMMLSKARVLHWFSLLSALAVQELQVGGGSDATDDRPSDEGNGDDFSRMCVIPAPTDRMRAELSPNMSGPIYDSGASATSTRRCSGMGRQLETFARYGDERAAPGGAQGPPRSSTSRVSTLRYEGNPLIDGRHSFFSGAIPLSSTGLSSWAPMGSATLSGPYRRPSLPSLPQERGAEQWRRAVHVIGEVTTEELDQIDRAHDRVLTVIKWILLDVSTSHVMGKLLIAPPILSRVYQELSNGMLSFFMAKMKISMVPFPFPFAQVLSYALYAFYVFCPFIVLEIMDGEDKLALEQISVPLMMNFAACVVYAAVNEIAIELEEPFGFDENDYPVHCHQNLIVRSMEDTYFAEAPSDFHMSDFK